MNQQLDFDYRHDPALPMLVPGTAKVGQRISVPCLHPDCNGAPFTYTYTGGAPRKYHSSEHANDWNLHGDYVTSPDGKPVRRVTWDVYEPVGAQQVEWVGKELQRDRWVGGDRRAAFRAAIKVAHHWADAADRHLRDLIASMRPGERRPLEPNDLAFRHPYQKPATPEPGRITTSTYVIPEPGQRNKDDSPFDQGFLDDLMGRRRVERREQGFAGGDTGVDYTGSANEAGADREEQGSPATAGVDPEAISPMFRESTAQSDGSASGIASAGYDSAAEMVRDATTGLDADSAELEVVTDVQERRSGGLRGKNAAEVLFAAFADWLFGKATKAQADIVYELRRRDPAQAAMVEAQARARILAAMSDAPADDLERLMARLSPPSSHRSGTSHPDNDSARKVNDK